MKNKHDCEHNEFEAFVSVARLTDKQGNVTRYSADVKIRCVECKMKMMFIEDRYGLSQTHTTVNIDNTELRVPLKPYDNSWLGQEGSNKAPSDSEIKAVGELNKRKWDEINGNPNLPEFRNPPPVPPLFPPDKID